MERTGGGSDLAPPPLLQCPLGGHKPERTQTHRLQAEYARLLEHKRIHPLDIPDDFGYMDPELVDMLEDAVKPYLTTWASCANLCHHSRTYKPSRKYESS